MAEGDGAWVVLGRKSDRFQSPSGDPERPQGVPEAGRGVILSVVFVFFEKWSANFWLSPQMQPFQTNSWQDSRCRLPPLRPSHIPPGYRRKPVICCICKEGLPLNKFSMAWQKKMMTLRQYTENIGARCLDCQYPKCSFCGQKPTAFLQHKVAPKTRAERDAYVCKDCKYPSCLGCKRPMTRKAREVWRKEPKATWTCQPHEMRFRSD